VPAGRPPANAINPGVSNAIYAALSMLQQDDDLRVDIITGSAVPNRYHHRNKMQARSTQDNLTRI
jgi:hypothetical protein